MAQNTSLPPARRRTTIEIPLHSIRRYVPGSGPPPPRISLLPPRDSTAYIIDQFVLPPDKDMTESSRRLIHYHVGFTDLPAVKLLIPCNKVLDYVSPRELEDWEYQNLEKKEEERARRLAEIQRAGAAKRKPGRPPKVPMGDIGVPAPDSADDALLLAQQVAGPSLSTPQKRKMGRPLDEEIEDSHSESDDVAIHRQLHRDSEAEGMEYEGGLEPDSESVDQLALQYDTPDMGSPSRVSSLARPLQDPSPSHRAVPTANMGLAVSASGTSFSPSKIPTPGRIHPAWAHAFNQQSHSENATGAHTQNGHPKQNGTPWSSLPKQPQSQLPFSTPTLGSAFKANNSVNGAFSHTSTPHARASSAVASDPSASKRKEQPHGLADSGEAKQNIKKRKVKEEPTEAADEWEVKELLDDQWFVEEGVKVHRYLVLWKGDWPEDQNPTWEPAENVLDKGLIKRYQKKKKAGLLKPSKKAQKTLHQFMAEARYSSVAEAFEGGIDEHQSTGGIEHDTNPPDETFLVTEAAADVKADATKPVYSATFGTFDAMLARYNQAFSRG